MPNNENTSYAAQYQAAQQRAAHAKTALAAFEKNLRFPLDDFQQSACRSVESGRAVLVAAPTGAGKTVVGEFGIYLALRKRLKAFYTTPIKALSNQKYHDFVREYGEETVGLLTGDTSINAEAPVLVMTTEVLRNMLYADSPTLEGLGYVILDEVHYLADRFRGAVWEEAIIHLPEHVTVISLSATVSNVEEFGAWLDTVRGGTDVIVSEHRPVPLWQHMLVGNQIVDLFTPDPGEKRASGARRATKRPKKDADEHTAPAGMRLNPQLKQLRPGYGADRGYRGRGGKRERFRRTRKHHSTAQTFEDSRRTPHAAQDNPLRPHRISRPEMVRTLDKAGLLPAICFIFSRAGCDGAVTQCIDADLMLTTDEQQRTIRASLASTRTYPLNSSFRPTYNMAANLIATYGAERTRKILESSFAQFQADKSVVGVAARVRKNENALAGYHESMRCHLGDFAEYFALRRDISALEKKAEKTNQRHARTQAHQSIQELLPGDIIHIPTGRLRGYAVVTTRAESNTDPRIGILTEDAHTRTATPRDFEGIIDPVSRIKLPKRLTLKTPKERRDTASRMRQALIDHKPPRETKHRTITERPNGLQEQLETLRTKMRNHPCHGCSERETHARWAERWYKLNSDTDGLRRQIARRTNTIAHVFNRIAQLLTSYGYVNRATDGELTLTSTGQSLRRIYGDKDLLTCLCLEAGFLNTLDPAAIAATIAALTYQGKRDTIEHLPRYPHPSLRESITTINRELARLNASEEEHKLTQTPTCDFGLVEPIYAWARGAHLAKALENTDLTAGDFVRWAKQVIDSLDQITHINGINADLRARCEKAIILIRRGVIALDI